MIARKLFGKLGEISAKALNNKTNLHIIGYIITAGAMVPRLWCILIVLDLPGETAFISNEPSVAVAV
jgi:hypothetical protein